MKKSLPKRIHEIPCETCLTLAVCLARINSLEERFGKMFLTPFLRHMSCSCTIFNDYLPFYVSMRGTLIYKCSGKKRNYESIERDEDSWAAKKESVVNFFKDKIRGL